MISCVELDVDIKRLGYYRYVRMSVAKLSHMSASLVCLLVCLSALLVCLSVRLRVCSSRSMCVCPCKFLAACFRPHATVLPMMCGFARVNLCACVRCEAERIE